MTPADQIRAALNELGVPDENYPAPIANAVEHLRAALLLLNALEAEHAAEKELLIEEGNVILRNLRELQAEHAEAKRGREQYGRMATEYRERVQTLEAEHADKVLALTCIARNAESWHSDEDGKARALIVIARWARDPTSIPDSVRLHALDEAGLPPEHADRVWLTRDEAYALLDERLNPMGGAEKDPKC